MSLKSIATGAMAVVTIGGAAIGVTSVAAPAALAQPGAPVPAEPAPCGATSAQFRSVIDALLVPGVGFRIGKSDLVEGGIGRIEGAAADGALQRAYARGALPAAIVVSEPICNPNSSATATLSTSTNSLPATFVPGGRFGWQLSRGSALAALSAFS